MKVIEDFLGPDFEMKINKAGDPIFLNKENTKRIRFDAKNPHGYDPHGHAEIYKNNRWKDYTEKHHIFLKNEPKEELKPKIILK